MSRRIQRLAAAIFCACALPAISAAQAPNREDAVREQAKWQDWETHRDQVKVTAVLFPDAAQVRLYACKCSIGIKFVRNRAVLDGPLPDDGVVLTPSEVDLLRKSVFYAPAPLAVPMCIMPSHHTFLFYDRRGNLLGALEISYEWSHAQIVPANPPRPDMDWIMLDLSNIAKIISAHKLPLHFNESDSCLRHRNHN